jgi:predicted 3-demethylubiquinone-9 3-methyltransferase (glyoxalase superfamily)
MNKIKTHIWFDTQAKQAAELYVEVFKNSKITSLNELHDTPSGDVDMVSLTLAGSDFMFMSAGPFFKTNPSISFTVRCESEEEVDAIWKKLSPGGKVLMELSKYPFSPHYGWVEDRFGVSWQVSVTDMPTQKITTSLLFTGNVAGKAEEAITMYTKLFPDSKIGTLSRYGKGMDPNAENSLNYASFTLGNQGFIAMDSAVEHKFGFNEAISLVVTCNSQEELDTYWEALSAVPSAEQCGWLKDKYGVSWQIVPSAIEKMLSSGNKEAKERVTQAFLKMKKFDIAALERAYKG